MSLLSAAHGRIKRIVLNRQPRAVVLMYHRIAEPVDDPFHLCVSPAHFAEQLTVLRKAYRVVPLEAVLPMLQERRLPPNAVAITFDDGYADIPRTAAGLLAGHEMPATVFVTTGYLDGKREYWWDELVRLVLESRTDPADWRIEGEERIPAVKTAASRLDLAREWQNRLRVLPPENRERMLDRMAKFAGLKRSVREGHRSMTAEECAALSRGGRIAVGAHTVHHAWLAALPEADQQREIRESKRALEEITGSAVTALAYPYGVRNSVSRRTLELAREAGLAWACANECGLVKADSDPYWIPRFLPHDVGGDAFAERMRAFFQDHTPIRPPAGSAK